MKATEVDNGQDIIDSRDVIQRISDLRDEFDGETWGDDEKAELLALEELQSQCEGYSDWTHGAALIRDSYFEDYARDLADDLGLTKPDCQWPYTCIDWEQAARELRMDYTSAEFDGVTYWVRS